MHKKAAIIGWPVSHSLSPILHSYWLKKYDQPGSYDAMGIPPENSQQIISALDDAGYCGANVTLPYKENIIAQLRHIDDAVKAIGAANTLIKKENGWHGTNTDAYGFSAHLNAQLPDVKKDKAVVLGAGGAARAIVYALKTEGFKNIVVCNRTQPKAQKLAETFGVQTIAWEKKEDALVDCDLLVNTTSLGMRGKEELKIGIGALQTQAAVADIVYNPLDTLLLKQAQEKGHATLDGLGMLLHQAVPAFSAWFGVAPVVDEALVTYVRGHL